MSCFQKIHNNQLPDREEGLLLIRHVDKANLLVPHPLRSLDSPALLKQGSEVFPSHLGTQFTDIELNHLLNGSGTRLENTYNNILIKSTNLFRLD